mmetsp:Transcript_25534/g.62710  ORF Transcript_25534/g.62710 Transcript_25534/m.62710 type:complete len:766 (-) Transcript_25534:355-2652(-)
MTQEVIALKTRARELEKELGIIHEALAQYGVKDENASYSPLRNNGSIEILPPPSKSGYLFKWQDRTIGFSGSKWALRFIKLDRGRITYYYSHLENQPRSDISLRGCAVRDEGWKLNRKHTSSVKGKDPPLEEAGAYFFVFSIYYRSDDSSAAAEELSSESFVPLFRFSTSSLAEKTQWIQILSEACAYCETDAFLREESNRYKEEENRRQQQLKMIEDMPQVERGTLAPLFIAPDKKEEERRTSMMRRPSYAKLPKSNLFRTQSKSRDAEKVDLGYAPSKPMHRRSAPSFLSAEARTQNYRGFFNLAMILLIVSNFRIFLNTIRSHGFILTEVWSNVEGFSFSTWNQFPLLSGILVLHIFLATAFLIEWLLATRRISNETIGFILHQLNTHTCFGLSVVIVWNFIDQPATGAFLLMNAAITWMKLISYSHANQDYRIVSRKDKDAHKRNLSIIDSLDTTDIDIEYPSNVTLGNIYYFWLAPTLTYQIAFPKSARIRKLRVLGLLFRMAITLSIFTFLGAQIVAPNLANLLKDLEATNGRYTYQMIAEYWLKLTISNTYMWLLMFYFYFHLYLNLFAELLRFGDRVFYKDWWNSAEVSAYWRLWNLPVHYWLVRHLYFPCVRRKMSRSVATFLVFLFSAVMHELLISIPFHSLRPWSFLGMMGQIPLVVVTKRLYRKFPGSSIGNILFWISFCVVGQPMAILLYTIDFNYGKMQDEGSPVVDGVVGCSLSVLGKCLITGFEEASSDVPHVHHSCDAGLPGTCYNSG